MDLHPLLRYENPRYKSEMGENDGLEGLKHGGMMIFKNPVLNLSCLYMWSSPLCQYKIQSM